MKGKAELRILLKSFETAQLLNKPYVNEVILRGKNLLQSAASPLKH